MPTNIVMAGLFVLLVFVIATWVTAFNNGYIQAFMNPKGNNQNPWQRPTEFRDFHEHLLIFAICLMPIGFLGARLERSRRAKITFILTLASFLIYLAHFPIFG